MTAALQADDIARIAEHAAKLARETVDARRPYATDEADLVEGGASAALSVAVLNIAHPCSVGGGVYSALLKLAGHLRDGVLSGVDSARWQLENAPVTPEFRAEHAARAHAIASVLELSGVDLGDDGRCVRELRAYADVLEADQPD